MEGVKRGPKLVKYQLPGVVLGLVLYCVLIHTYLILPGQVCVFPTLYVLLLGLAGWPGRAVRE